MGMGIYLTRVVTILKIMNKFKNAEWEQFFLSELFTTIRRGKRLTKKAQTPGDIPYVSSTAFNNGVDAFIGNTQKVRRYENCLTIANSGSVGSVFFHPYSFIASDHVTALINPSYKREHYLFIGTCLKLIGDKYSFNREISDKRIRREQVLLPIDTEGKPDFNLMEQFILETEKKVHKDVVFPNIIKADTKPTLENKKWGNFTLDELCDISGGVRLTKKNMKVGKTPFIGATDNNNGVTNFVSNRNKSLDSNVLGVNYNGSVVESFYHPYKAIFTDDVKRLHIKPELLGNPNKYHYLFLKTCILKQKSKYMYGYKFNETRMRRQIITLPINAEGEPDWIFMEEFMKWKEAQVISAASKCK
ncbi:restriction endonuclease [Bacillus paranthracis]|nr:restriction endonuclease [Bacillus paranthracis]NUJ08075.1 restriction endonuclease [Bacillus paranthracis]